MAKSSVIVTPRLRIEPFGPAHLSERYVGWLNNSPLMRFSEQRHSKHTLESCRHYAESYDSGPNYFWAVLAPKLGGHVGNLTAHVDPIHSSADLGIVLGEAQGKGLATEAWTAVCDYLLREARLRKVTAGTLAVNTAMLEIMRRTGMAEDGRRRRHLLWEGKEEDVLHFALFREEWLKRFANGPFE